MSEIILGHHCEASLTSGVDALLSINNNYSSRPDFVIGFWTAGPQSVNATLSRVDVASDAAYPAKSRMPHLLKQTPHQSAEVHDYPVDWSIPQDTARGPMRATNIRGYGSSYPW